MPTFATYAMGESAKLPPNRTAEYYIWKGCCLIGVRPPGLPDAWDKMSVVQQGQVIAFAQIVEQDNAANSIHF